MSARVHVLSLVAALGLWGVWSSVGERSFAQEAPPAPLPEIPVLSEPADFALEETSGVTTLRRFTSSWQAGEHGCRPSLAAVRHRRGHLRSCAHDDRALCRLAAGCPGSRR